MQLEVTRPMCLWSWKHNAGMYAYICMPEYAKLYLIVDLGLRSFLLFCFFRVQVCLKKIHGVSLVKNRLSCEAVASLHHHLGQGR